MALGVPHKTVADFLGDTKNWEYLNEKFPLSSNELGENSISGNQLQDNSVTNSHLQDNIINVAEIGILPSTRVYHNTTQSIADSTEVAVVFNSERFDNDIIHDTSSNTSRLTCKTAGVYSITAHIRYAAGTLNDRSLILKVNNSTYITPWGATGREQSVSITTDYKLAVDDYVEAIAYHTHGSARNIISSANQTPEFMMHWISKG